MPTDLIRYDLLVQDALKSVVRRVLTDAARDGLPGDHHFYVSFRTDHGGVRVSGRLKERYPQDMTIVLQHQFDELTVGDQFFEVGLSFSGVAERLRVPFDALTGFFDPSVQFGLKFEIETPAAEGAAAPEAPAAEPIPIKQPRVGLPAPKGAKTGPRKLEDVEEAPARPAPEKRSATKRTPPPAADEKGTAPAASAEVVSLDSFRKKS